MSSRAWIESWIRRFEHNGYLPLLALTVAIQGTVLISQALATLLIPLGQTGAIRTFESVASVAIMCGSLGTQTLAIRETAATRDPVLSEKILNELLFLPFIGASLLGLVALGLIVSNREPGGIGAASLAPAVALILLVGLTRLLSGAAQGLFKVTAVYRSVITGSIAAACFQIGGALGGSLTSWIVGRCLGETILLASIARAMLKACPSLANLGGASPRRILAWVRTGLSVNIGLILRMTADALPIVMMGAASSRAAIGQFGTATLALTLATLPIAVLTQQALPLLAAATPASQRRQFWQLVMKLLGCAMLLAIGTTIFGWVGRPWVGPAGQGSLTAIMVILWTLPLRALALALGALALGRSNYLASVVVNMVEVAALVAIMTSNPFGNTIWTPLLAVFIGAGVSCLGLALYTFLSGSRGRQPDAASDAMIMVD